MSMKNLLAVVLLFISFNSVFAQFNYLPVSKKKGQVVKHKYYTLSYNEVWEQPNWVAYELKAAYLKKNAERKNNFRPDPKVSSHSAALSDYSKTGYDRGHLLPAASMAFSKEAMSETFFMSNMSPQKPYFNRGVWKKLEAKIRNWTLKYKHLYVVTGPVVGKSVTTIGKNKVVVPTHFYKVVWNPTTKQGIAFLLKNEKSSEPLSSFVVTIDRIEKLTGIDFFSSLPDNVENTIESKVVKAKWVF